MVNPIHIHDFALSTALINLFCLSYAFSFTSQKFRTIHVKQVHERKFRRVCYICAKDCSTGNALQRHLLEEHSGVEQPRVNCHVCDKSYKNDKGLKSHMMVHEDEGKRFPCPHCSKISPNRRALGTHIVEQHKFKPQKCNLCEKECKTKRELRVSSVLQNTLDHWTHNNLIFVSFLRPGAHFHAHRRIFIQLCVLYAKIQVPFRTLPTLQTVSSN